MPNTRVSKRLHHVDSPEPLQRTPKQRKLIKGRKSDLWGDESLFGEILSQDYMENKDVDEDDLNANILLDDSDFDVDATICHEPKKLEYEFNETFQIPNDFVEEKPVIDELQGTERFFEDIKVDFNDSDFREFQSSQTVEGSCYETKENIIQKSQSQTFKIPPTPKGFSQICWQTQVFEQEINCKSFMSKGPFYGLPKKVEKLIYSSKGIKALYGKFICLVIILKYNFELGVLKFEVLKGIYHFMLFTSSPSSWSTRVFY